MKNQLLTIVILAGTLFLSSCKTNNKTEEVEVLNQEYYISLTDTQIKAGNLVLDSVREASFDGLIDVTGMIEVPPSSMADVTTFLNGNVKDFSLIAGQKVQKGQTLN